MATAKHKKQQRTLIGWVLFLAVLVGAFFLTKGLSDAVDDAVEGVELYNLTVSDLEGLGYTTGDKNYTFTYDSVTETWTYAADQRFPLSGTTMNNLALYITEFSAQRIAVKNLDDLATYGLDAPGLTVTLDPKNAEPFTLYFGDQNANSGHYYMYMDGSTNIYTVESTIWSYFGYDLAALAEQEALPVLSASTVTELKFSSAANTWKIYTVYEEGTAEDGSSTSNLVWMAENASGKQVRANQDTVSELLTTLESSFCYSAFLGYADDAALLAEAGLNDPGAVLTASCTDTATGELLDLQVSIGSAKDDIFYAHTEGSQYVNAFTSSLMTVFTDMTFEQLIAESAE